MNNKQAKRIRREIYGSDMSPRHRVSHKRLNAEVTAGDLRRKYQKAKKRHFKVTQNSS